MSGTRKSFAFVGFDSAQAVDQLCAMSKHTIGSKQVRHQIRSLLILLCRRLHASICNYIIAINYSTASVVRLNAT